MSSVNDVERAVRELSGPELAEFRKWFFEFDAQVWDAELESDIQNGKLDSLGDLALEEHRSGRSRPL